VALGVNIVDRGAAGDLFFRVVDVTCDNSYPAGGWAITPAQLGFGANGVVYQVQTPGVKDGFFLEYDSSTAKLKVRDASGAANTLSPEITTVTLMNNKVIRLIAWGKGQG